MRNENIFRFDENDIVSSSSSLRVNNNNNDFIISGKGKHYAKKKRGAVGFFSRTGAKISGWWRKRRTWQKAMIITGTSLVLVAAIAFGVLRLVFDYNYNNITKNPEDLGFENVINDKIINVALFGIDTRKIGSFKGLSDSIMILSINTETKKIKLISVMRDSLVPITYNGKTTYTKINSAYSKGGPELAIKTLNTIFKLDISEYATVNFYGMAEIIDAVGGIDATLAEGELDYYGYENGKKINWGLNGLISEQCAYMKIDPAKYYIKTGGKHHLNGVQAVAYARIRHAANIEGTKDDYGRTDRQRYVMEQLFNKALTLQKSQYIKLAKALIPCSETSLSYTEIMGLAVNVLLHSPTFEQTRVPLTDYQMPNKSYVYYDLDYASKLIHAFIYDNIKPEDYIKTNGVEKNDWYSNRYSTGSGTSGNKTNNTSGGSANKTSSITDGTSSVNPGSSSDSQSTGDTESQGYESNIDSGGQTGSEGEGQNPSEGQQSGNNNDNQSGNASSGGDNGESNQGGSSTLSSGTASGNTSSTPSEPAVNTSSQVKTTV